MFRPPPTASVVVVVALGRGCACFVGVFIRGWEIDRCFLEAVTCLAGLHLALELVGWQKVRVVLFGTGVATRLRPGGVGIRGGFGGRGAVVEVAGEDEVGCWSEETGHWRYRVLGRRRLEQGLCVIGTLVRQTLGGVPADRGGGDGREDETADDVLPVLVPAAQLVLHGRQVRRHEREGERRVTDRVAHPHAHGALVAHLAHADPHARRLQPADLRRLIPQDKDHEGGHADVAGDDVDVAGAVEGGGRDGDGMAEGGEVGEEVGAAEEGMGDWGELLEAEDEDIGGGGGGEGGEEVGGEDGGINWLAATVEGYDVGIECGHR